VIPGINEAIDRHDLALVRQQVAALAVVLQSATAALEGQR
jgi:hypothetical protein